MWILDRLTNGSLVLLTNYWLWSLVPVVSEGPLDLISRPKGWIISFSNESLVPFMDRKVFCLIWILFSWVTNENKGQVILKSNGSLVGLLFLPAPQCFTNITLTSFSKEGFINDQWNYKENSNTFNLVGFELQNTLYFRSYAYLKLTLLKSYMKTWSVKKLRTQLWARRSLTLIHIESTSHTKKLLCLVLYAFD